MRRIIRVIIQNSLHRNINREEVNNRDIEWIPDHSIVNLLFASVLVQRILNYYPNHLSHRLYFGVVETPYYEILLCFKYCYCYIVMVIPVPCSFIKNCLLIAEQNRIVFTLIRLFFSQVEFILISEWKQNFQRQPYQFQLNTELNQQWKLYAIRFMNDT